MPAPRKPAKSSVEVVNSADEMESGVLLPGDVALNSLLDGLEGDMEATVNIYRQGKNGYRDLTLIDEMPVSEFKPILLRDPPFGGGEFRIHIQDGKGAFIANKYLRVEPRPVAATPAQAAQNDSLVIVSAMANGFQELGKLIVASAQANVKPPQTRAEMLQEMKLLADLFRPAAPMQAPADNASSVLSAARQMLTMVESMRPDKTLAEAVGNGEVSENAMLLGLAEKFFASINKMKEGAPPAAQVQTLAASRSEAPQQATAAPAVAQPEINEMTAALAMFLPVLINQAELDGDEQTYANVILDHAGDERAIEFLEAPDWFEKLLAMAQGAQPALKVEHRAWFDKLRNSIVEMLRESEDAEIAKRAKAIRLTSDETNATVAATPALVQ